ncbi:MAG TPA: hypothetical protein VM076_13305 [Gemmatimonadaceae bacterium]|nr:hypothetical protein [Gemmatimonadaceae bacterium]
MRARVVLAAAAALMTLSCATTGASSNGLRPKGRSQDIIAESEITASASEAGNALQIIEKLRPQMLRSRGLGSPTDVKGESARPKVYVDNVEYGDLGTLTNLAASQIKEIQFINSRDATTKWGTGHMGGVILVTTRR